MRERECFTTDLQRRGKALLDRLQTGEMIRQIPSKERVEIARSLDKMQGMLLHQKA